MQRCQCDKQLAECPTTCTANTELSDRQEMLNIAAIKFATSNKDFIPYIKQHYPQLYGLYIMEAAGEA